MAKHIENPSAKVVSKVKHSPPTDKELSWYRSGYFYIGCLIVALHAASTWFLEGWWHSNEHCSVRTLYYRQDMQYFPIFLAQSQGNLGDAIATSNVSKGLAAFPFASTFPHAAAIFAFGVYGFPIADAAIAVIYFFLLRCILRFCGISQTLSCVFSVLITTHIVQNAASSLIEAGFLPVLAATDLFGERIPRPYVSEMYSLFTLCGMMLLWSSSRRWNKWGWVFCGVGLALTVQGDIYSGMALSFSLALNTLALFFVIRKWKQTLVGTVLMTAIFFIMSTPFFIQRSWAHPDSSRRLGLIPIPRKLVVEIPFPEVHFTIFALMLALLATYLAPAVWKADRQRKVYTSLAVLGGVAILACCAMHLSILLIGQGIQLYHFEPMSVMFANICTVTCAVLIVCIFGESLERRFRFIKSRLKPANTRLLTRCLALSLMLFPIALIAYRLSPNSGFSQQSLRHTKHVRNDLDRYNKLPSGYRESFNELATELMASKYKKCNSMGTLDEQILVWWTVFREGTVFCPDPFSSTLPDSEIENRLASFSKLLGVTNSSKFQEIIKDQVINIFFLGHNKYQANSLYTFSSPEDYPPEVREKLLRTSPLSCWELSVPLSEIKRLVDIFQNANPDYAAENIDLIVLNRVDEDEGLLPNEKWFQQTWQNNLFSVWIRRDLSFGQAAKF